MTDDQQQQINLYGRLLTGKESALELAKLARRQYLKGKMRPKLAASIGDYGDNITDVTRGLTLGDAIALGIETDAKVIERYTAYVKLMYTIYGGGAAIMDVLEANMAGLQDSLVTGYYASSQAIDAAETEEEVRAVDLAGEPVVSNGWIG